MKGDIEKLDSFSIDPKSTELMNFLKPSRPELGNLLARIYGACDSFSLDPEIALSDKKELKDCAQILLLKLQDE